MAARLEAVVVAGLLPPSDDPRSDADLLQGFRATHDEAAFTCIVTRHTPAVRAVCRSWLRCEADIDDATQATFFVLVRRPDALRQPQALGRWLCRTAENIAKRLKAQQRTTTLSDEPLTEVPLPDDTASVLAAEVARLPEAYRRVVQLCYYAGFSTADAAAQLGWPKGTVLTRLAWAKKRLHARLSGRGVAPAVLVALASQMAPAVNARWLLLTVRGGLRYRAGHVPTDLGLAPRTFNLTEGVVQTMFWNKVKVVAVGLLLAAVIGFGVGRWAIAGPTPTIEPRREAAPEGPIALGNAKPSNVALDEPAKDGVKNDKPAVVGRRKEAVIRVPSGTFTKEIDAAPHGAGRITWTYDEDKVTGTIEGSAMGLEFEIHIDAEYSLSSNGTIYGLITGFKVSHLKLPPGDGLGELAEYAALWQLLEPVLTEMIVDVPFSYQFRLQGDRMAISNFRMLLSGPLPLNKVTAIAGLVGGGGNDAAALLGYFQAISLVLEGNYTAEGKEPAPAKKPAPFFKPRGKVNAQPLNLGNILGGTKSSSRSRSMMVPNPHDLATTELSHTGLPAGVPPAFTGPLAP